MKVITVRPHENAHGARLRKARGDVYELPDREAANLAEQGLVRRADPLDHDGDGRRGGSPPGGASTAAKGARRRRRRERASDAAQGTA